MISENIIGQERSQIHGRVVDILTKQSIENAHIIINNSCAGTTTDSSGVFSINTNLSNIELRISHISYQTNILEINLKKENKINFDIQLTPKSFELNEAVISAKRQYKYSVTDFHFINTHILLLATKHRNNSYELSLLNESFDTIAKLTHLPSNKQGSIYKDCLGNCHLLLKDSAYEVAFDGNKISLIYPVNIKRFYELMENCLTETTAHIVFTKPTQNKYKHTYYAINKQSLEVHEFISDFEQEKMFALNDELRFIERNPNAFPNAASRGLAIMYAHQIAFKPSKNFLDRIGDTIYYFNHAESVIELFSNDLKHLTEFDINYHLSVRWESKIMTDKSVRKAYTIYTTGVKFMVHEINLRNGKIIPKQIIPLAYPEKLKINNGYLYFLYKETGNIWAKKELYRLKL